MAFIDLPDEIVGLFARSFWNPVKPHVLAARKFSGPPPSERRVARERQRILVHQLPERAQIDVPLTEQLIVELYSK